MSPLYPAARTKISNLIQAIYKDSLDHSMMEKFFRLIESNIRENVTCQLEQWNEQDTVLITYGNSIHAPEQKPLKTLHTFLNKYLKGNITCVHILPFFPYSSDDGFSVIDYYKVNPGLGDWENIQGIHQDFDLMFDLVINHVSKESEWFQNFLYRKDPGKDYFIEMNTEKDLSMVTRPRSSNLLTPFETKNGKKYVWTTFSEDQVDLDFSNPMVLYEMLKILFFYIHKGARIIRLDAIAYLWKKEGTSCIHLPETHMIVNLIRELAELVDPNTLILTETNVPNKENLSYFGPKYNEAHMIYQFSLPPLLLHALHSGNSQHLSSWAQSIPETNGKGTYLNFTASHDGIGVRPLEGILPDTEKNDLIQKMKDFGGYVSTKKNKDGTESPYEINITYFDALKGTSRGEDDFQIERFICSQTIMMALKGIPAFYIHSLLAKKNDHTNVEKQGKYRAINRSKLEFEEIKQRLSDPESETNEVMMRLNQLIQIRQSLKVFHPDSQQMVFDFGEPLFAFKRISEEEEVLWNISNISSVAQTLNLSMLKFQDKIIDLIGNNQFRPDQMIKLHPYQTLWLKKL